MYDVGTRSHTAVPRALWYGLEFIRYALSRLWGLPMPSALLRGKDAARSFDHVLRGLSAGTLRRMRVGAAGGVVPGRTAGGGSAPSHARPPSPPPPKYYRKYLRAPPQPAGQGQHGQGQGQHAGEPTDADAAAGVGVSDVGAGGSSSRAAGPAPLRLYGVYREARMADEAAERLVALLHEMELGPQAGGAARQGGPGAAGGAHEADGEAVLRRHGFRVFFGGVSRLEWAAFRDAARGGDERG